MEKQSSKARNTFGYSKFKCGSGYTVVLIGDVIETIEIEVIFDDVSYPIKRYSTLEKLDEMTKEQAISLLTPCDIYEDISPLFS